MWRERPPPPNQQAYGIPGRESLILAQDGLEVVQEGEGRPQNCDIPDDLTPSEGDGFMTALDTHALHPDGESHGHKDRRHDA